MVVQPGNITSATGLGGICEASLRNDPSQQEQLMLSQSNAASNMIAERRIYCLTPKSNSTLMWSHYVQNHRGICLEFGVDNPLFRNALEVVYCRRYPVWIANKFEARHELTKDMIRTKAWAWRYEKEFRLQGPPPFRPYSTNLNQFSQSRGGWHLFAVQKHSLNMEFNCLVD
jgi:hypothetical protein